MPKVFIDSQELDTLATEVTKLQLQLQNRFWGKLTLKDGKFLDGVQKNLNDFSNILYRLGHS